MLWILYGKYAFCCIPVSICYVYEHVSCVYVSGRWVWLPLDWFTQLSPFSLSGHVLSNGCMPLCSGKKSHVTNQMPSEQCLLKSTVCFVYWYTTISWWHSSKPHKSIRIQWARNLYSKVKNYVDYGQLVLLVNVPFNRLTTVHSHIRVSSKAFPSCEQIQACLDNTQHKKPCLLLAVGYRIYAPFEGHMETCTGPSLTR